MVATRFPRPDVPACVEPVAPQAPLSPVSPVYSQRAPERCDRSRPRDRSRSPRPLHLGRETLRRRATHRGHGKRLDEGEDRPHQGPDAPSQLDRRSGTILEASGCAVLARLGRSGSARRLVRGGASLTRRRTHAPRPSRRLRRSRLELQPRPYRWIRRRTIRPRPCARRPGRRLRARTHGADGG